MGGSVSDCSEVELSIKEAGIKPPVIILGMHRSGTSCLTGSLQQAGLALGDVHTANPFNKKGNREHPDLMALHESLLESNGGSWHQPPKDVVWSASYIKKRDQFCEQFAGAGDWGFKDPRALLALDGWLARFPDARLVGTIRHPLSVARSLHRRDPSLHTLEEYMQVWAEYNRRLLAAWRVRPFPVVDFDEPDPVYMASLQRVLPALGLREGLVSLVRRFGLVKGLRLALGGESEPFFDPDLRTHRLESLDGLPAEIAELYLELKQMASAW